MLCIFFFFFNSDYSRFSVQRFGSCSELTESQCTRSVGIMHRPYCLVVMVVVVVVVVVVIVVVVVVLFLLLFLTLLLWLLLLL